MWFGVAASRNAGLRIIPTTLLMRGLLALAPGGKKIMSMDLGDDNAWYRATLSELLRWLAAGEIDPVVAERIPLEEASRAHALLERGGHAGKAVLVTRFYETRAPTPPG